MNKLYAMRFFLALICSFLAGVVVEQCHLVYIPMFVLMLGVIGAFMYDEIEYAAREEGRHDG